jgi:putative endonuclease
MGPVLSRPLRDVRPNAAERNRLITLCHPFYGWRFRLMRRICPPVRDRVRVHRARFRPQPGQGAHVSPALPPPVAAGAGDEQGWPPEVVAVTSTQQQRSAVGRYGEDVAVRHLTGKGMQVLARNWRCDLGEIDVVARDCSTIVVCEVKTRRGLDYGTPLEAVTARKMVRLRRLADRWVAESVADSCDHPPDVRIDVVSVLLRRQGAAMVEHLRGVA